MQGRKDIISRKPREARTLILGMHGQGDQIVTGLAPGIAFS